MIDWGQVGEISPITLQDLDISISLVLTMIVFGCVIGFCFFFIAFKNVCTQVTGESFSAKKSINPRFKEIFENRKELNNSVLKISLKLF